MASIKRPIGHAMMKVSTNESTIEVHALIVEERRVSIAFRHQLEQLSRILSTHSSNIGRIGGQTRADTSGAVALLVEEGRTLSKCIFKRGQAQSFRDVLTSAHEEVTLQERFFLALRATKMRFVSFSSHGKLYQD